MDIVTELFEFLDNRLLASFINNVTWQSHDPVARPRFY